jgi:hypothetical protein
MAGGSVAAAAAPVTPIAAAVAQAVRAAVDGTVGKSGAALRADRPAMAEGLAIGHIAVAAGNLEITIEREQERQCLGRPGVDALLPAGLPPNPPQAFVVPLESRRARAGV